MKCAVITSMMIYLSNFMAISAGALSLTLGMLTNRHLF